MSTNENESKAPQIVRKIGVVKSDKMQKTIVVKVERKLMHPLYKKIVTRFTTLVAHDENNEAKIGDSVQVVFTRPLSKRKRWRLEKVLEVAVGGEA
jgi:small subunit ribosomal protein S17